MQKENTATNTDWKLVQFQYEALDYSLEQLSEEHDLSLPLLKYAAKDGNWTQIPLPSLEDSSPDEITANTKQRQAIINSLAQRFVGPKISSLGCILLNKTIKMANLVDPTNARSANTLKTLTSIYEQLKVSYFPDTNDIESVGEHKWEIEIVEPKNETASQANALSNEKEAV